MPMATGQGQPTSTAPTPQIKTQARVTLHPTSATNKTLLVSGQGHPTSWTVSHSSDPPLGPYTLLPETRWKR